MASLSARYHSKAASECSALISPYRLTRSRSAREVMLTRYAMRGFELGEKLPCGPSLSFFHVLQALPNTFLGVRQSGNIETVLIGFGVLYDGGCFPFDRDNHRTLAFLRLLHEIAGPTPESRQRLDILGDVKHCPAPKAAPF